MEPSQTSEIAARHQPGDWSIWQLAEDKVRPESWGWCVTTQVNPKPTRPRRMPLSTAVGGFTHTRPEAEAEVAGTLRAYGFGSGREAQ